jgi:pimeloyl-ACP methyl ester carboxylesterase
MPFVTARGIKFSYRQDGAGQDVVLIHGVAGNMAVWYLCGLVRALSQHFRVTAYDLRGHGYSESTPTGYTSRDMADDLLELLRELGLKRVYLLGHSFGAAVALQAALAEPETVGGVIISDAYLPGFAQIHGLPHQWPGWRAYKRLAEQAGLAVSDDWNNLQELFEQATQLSDDQKQEFARIAGKGVLERLIRAASTTCGRDVAEPAGLTAERVLTITQPVVCLFGEHSPFRRLSTYLAENLPRCRQALVPSAEHFAFDENPDAYVQLAHQQLGELAGIDAGPGGAISSVRRTETMMARGAAVEP